MMNLLEDFLRGDIAIKCRNKRDYDELAHFFKMYTNIEVFYRQFEENINSGELLYVAFDDDDWSLLSYIDYGSLEADYQDEIATIGTEEFCREMIEEIEKKWFPLNTLIVVTRENCHWIDKEVDGIIWRAASFAYEDDTIWAVSIKSGDDTTFNITEVAVFS